MLMVKEEVSSECSSSLDLIQDADALHVTEEQEERWTSQEGEQLNVLEEADITRSPFTTVSVKSAADEDKPQTSQLHESQTENNRETEPSTSSSANQVRTEADGEDSGGLDPAWSLELKSLLQPNHEEKASDSSETEVSDEWQEPLSDSGSESQDSDDGWNKNRAPESGVRVSDEVCNAEKKSFTCFECGKRFNRQTNLKIHKRVHTGEKEFGCDACGKRFNRQSNLKTHMRVHTGENPFHCCVCKKRFSHQGSLKTHLSVYTG